MHVKAADKTRTHVAKKPSIIRHNKHTAGKNDTWNVKVARACMQWIALKLGSLRHNLSDFTIAHKSPSSTLSTWYPHRGLIISQTAVHATGFMYDYVIWF